MGRVKLFNTSPRIFKNKASINPQVIDDILELMIRKFEYIIIDGGHNPNLLSLKLHAKSDIVILIAVLTYASLSNTKEIFKSFNDLGYPVERLISVVVNRYLNNSEISQQDAEKERPSACTQHLGRSHVLRVHTADPIHDADRHGSEGRHGYHEDRCGFPDPEEKQRHGDPGQPGNQLKGVEDRCRHASKALRPARREPDGDARDRGNREADR